MRNNDSRILKILASLGITATSFLYTQYKKGNIKLTIERGFLKVDGRVKGQPLRLSIPLPDASNVFHTLNGFNKKYLKK